MAHTVSHQRMTRGLKARRSWSVGRIVRVLATGIGITTGIVVILLTAGYLWLPAGGDARARADSVLAVHGGSRTPATVDSRALRAVVAVEDRRFFDHGALDGRALVRAAAHTATGQGGDAGGSTIAQQLARRLYGEGALSSVGMAFKVERAYSKLAILRMYADAIYYGNGYWGVERASRGYFGRSAARLDWAEASLLAGLPQAPSAYDPVESFGSARRRQREVLRALVRQGSLTPADAGRAYGELTSLRR